MNTTYMENFPRVIFRNTLGKLSCLEGEKVNKEFIIKSILFITYLSIVFKVIDYIQLNWMLDLTLLLVFSFVYTFTEAIIIRKLSKLFKRRK